MKPRVSFSDDTNEERGNLTMKASRKKIIIGVMIPAIIALIVLRRTMGLPSVNGLSMVTIDSLLLTGALLGIAIAQGISAFRKPQ